MLERTVDVKDNDGFKEYLTKGTKKILAFWISKENEHSKETLEHINNAIEGKVQIRARDFDRLTKESGKMRLAKFEYPVCTSITNFVFPNILYLLSRAPIHKFEDTLIQYLKTKDLRAKENIRRNLIKQACFFELVISITNMSIDDNFEEPQITEYEDFEETVQEEIINLEKYNVFYKNIKTVDEAEVERGVSGMIYKNSGIEFDKKRGRKTEKTREEDKKKLNLDRLGMSRIRL